MNPIDGYVRDMKRRGLSSATIDKRRRCLRLTESEVGLRIEREDLEDWLDTRNLSAKSRSVWLSHLAGFYQWALMDGCLPDDPTAMIRRPKLRRKLPRPMPPSDLAKALKAANPEIRCWLLLGAYAGLRCQEIAGLKGEDVSDGLLRVTDAKGGNERMVPLHKDVLKALQIHGLPESGPVFRQRGGDKATPGAVAHRLGAYLRSLGITSTPHALRHSFGTELMRSCHDIRVVQEAMGHRSIASTAIYTAVDQVATRRAIASLGKAS